MTAVEVGSAPERAPHLRGVALALLAASCGTTSSVDGVSAVTVQHDTSSAEQAGDGPRDMPSATRLDVGRLSLPWPAGWRRTSDVPVFAAEPRDADCVCVALDARAMPQLPSAPAPGLVEIDTGRDRVVLDTHHMIFWPGDCYEPCYLVHAPVDAEGRVADLLAEYVALRGRLTRRHLFHKVLPAVNERTVGGQQLFHMNGEHHVAGRSGLYYAGGPGQVPVNVYGRRLSHETIEQLYQMMLGATVRD